ncbi:SPFH domain-containing protein [Pseudomonas sp. KNUC1026]|uniref:SPFH domain-containing protein n=1 Tax=Pseudomonas sp. KNUC1026 TaxID=2893890 RepID=UPI001EFF4407|nr:SPFH domain-containing protein [Pseudomonas sp. KNUC1026]UFH49275.1 protease modulator HflK [Pseudomonas sp. KNUC1026]
MSQLSERGVGPWHQATRLAFIGLYLVTLLAALAWLFSNVRQVAPQDRAVVLRFGAIERVAGAGLLMAWPQPVEQVVTVPGPERVLQLHVQGLQRSNAARDAELKASYVTPVSDALAGSGYLLTGDAGVVQLDLQVFYRVTDPRAWVLQGDHVLPALDRVITRSAIGLAAARDLDTILVARPEMLSQGNQAAERRERLRADLVQSANQRLRELEATGQGLGVELERVDVQSSLPADAVSAFNAVLTATQEADKALATARNDAQKTLQAATQKADRLLAVAHAQASEQVAQAQAATATITGLARSDDPGLALRLYRERLPAILGKAGSVTTVDPRDDSRLILQGADR